MAMIINGLLTHYYTESKNKNKQINMSSSAARVAHVTRDLNCSLPALAPQNILYRCDF